MDIENDIDPEQSRHLIELLSKLKNAANDEPYTALNGDSNPENCQDRIANDKPTETSPISIDEENELSANCPNIIDVNQIPMQQYLHLQQMSLQMQNGNENQQQFTEMWNKISSLIVCGLNPHLYSSQQTDSTAASGDDGPSTSQSTGSTEVLSKCDNNEVVKEEQRSSSSDEAHINVKDEPINPLFSNRQNLLTNFSNFALPVPLHQFFASNPNTSNSSSFPFLPPSNSPLKQSPRFMRATRNRQSPLSSMQKLQPIRSCKSYRKEGVFKDPLQDDDFRILSNIDEDDSDLTPFQRSKLMERKQIIRMWKQGKYLNEIMQDTGVSRGTIRKWIRKWMEEGPNLMDKHRTGRKKKFNVEDLKRIEEAAKDKLFTNSVALINRLKLNISSSAVRRHLREMGFKHQVYATKEKLTEAQKEERLRFANEFLLKDEEFWRRVIYTDEKTFIRGTKGRVNCWRLNSCRDILLRKSGNLHVSCNVWGWIHAQGVGELAVVDGNLTAETYTEILEQVMLPSVHAYALPPTESILYVQNSSTRSRAHNCHTVREWFGARTDEIHVIQWPSKGCDLNPIENVWAVMTENWNNRDSLSIYEQALLTWEQLRKTPNIIEKLVLSMPQRLTGVIENKGDWTK